MEAKLTPRQFTAEEYDRMGQAGILGEDDRVELLEGEIVSMSPIGARHAACVVRLTRLFERLFGDSALVSVQNPLRLGERSEPQPDVMLLRPRADFYARRLPEASDVLLLVEVAETSVATDAQVKIPLYSRHGIHESWLVDLPGERVIVYLQPVAGDYGEVQTFSRGHQIAVAARPRRAVSVDDILGPSQS